ncbi:MAG: hypothetical protein LBR12_02345 [Opitutaceae bacterium]|jgi:hypothetical protein|nr:hypothetical protein [Opitutaceae bacterium]
MNKTLLLILCDFLLLNLLALTNWQSAGPITPKQVRSTAPAKPDAPAPASKDDDLVDLMRRSLADEQQRHQQAAGDLDRRLREMDAALASRDKALADSRRQLDARAAALAEQQAAAGRLARRADDLARRLDGEQAASRQAAEASATQLARLRAELARQTDEARRQQQRVSLLENEQTAAREKIEDLSVAVKVAEREKTLLAETARVLETQIAAEQADRRQSQNATLQLARGLTETTASIGLSIGELKQTLVDNRPRTPNEIYDAYLRAHRVRVRLRATRAGGNLSPLVSALLLASPADPAAPHALLLATGTPVDPSAAPREWLWLLADIQKDTGSPSVAAQNLLFLSTDPRLLAIPVPRDACDRLDVSPCKIAPDPLRATRAILINPDGRGYGAAAFSLDPRLPDTLRNRYLRMDTSLFQRLFGDFAPATGDIVLNETGELIGLMVNNTYCAIVDTLLPAQTIATGAQSPARTDEQLQTLARRVKQLPQSLQ